MVFDVAPLLCPFIVTSDIFTLKKDTAKMHYNNVGLNVLDNAPLAVYQATLAEHQLVMGFKTDNSPIDARLSKMEATIKHIVFLTAIGNIAINQLMEREEAAIVTTKVTSMEEPKWTMMIAKNVHQVVSRAVETLADTPK
jgi:hypothetical protein